MPLRWALTGCKDLWVSHYTSQDAPVMRKPAAVDKGSSAKDCALAQGFVPTHGVLQLTMLPEPQLSREKLLLACQAWRILVFNLQTSRADAWLRA